MSATLTRYHLGPLAAVPVGEGRVYRLAEREVVVFRTRTGGIYATQAECPHRNGPLSDGLLADHCVICPLHGYAFDLRTGRAVGSQCPPLVTYHASVDAGGELTVEWR
jgi:nitrite reductase (NADH) small subunit